MTKKFQKKVNSSHFKLIRQLLDGSMSYLTQLSNDYRGQLVDKTFDERSKLFERCAQLYRHLYFDYEHDLDVMAYFRQASEIFYVASDLFMKNIDC